MVIYFVHYLFSKGPLILQSQVPHHPNIDEGRRWMNLLIQHPYFNRSLYHLQ